MKFDEMANKVINEGFTKNKLSAIIKVNKDRKPGDNVIDENGKIIKDKKLLEVSEFGIDLIRKDKDVYVITQLSTLAPNEQYVTLTQEAFKILQKVKF